MWLLSRIHSGYSFFFFFHWNMFIQIVSSLIATLNVESTVTSWDLHVHWHLISLYPLFSLQHVEQSS
ncbi:hypothetical protein IGI04_008843 [Brassica rapa subsp. trilocularis]|uniref:Uncharacterized protein n=1 Tax=Brassica rapa subsp. trilocularis TaxID=1813537 RepID=A0ABQ7MVL0_BRACM|nr:hypothetical protein IGI04_008843 [Brassica rapa subsp. trilocularis]